MAGKGSKFLNYKNIQWYKTIQGYSIRIFNDTKQYHAMLQDNTARLTSCHPLTVFSQSAPTYKHASLDKCKQSTWAGLFSPLNNGQVPWVCAV